MSGDMGSMRVQVFDNDDLISFLWRAYLDSGHVTGDPADFARWAKRYLANNPPRQTFAANNNAGLVLANGTRVLVSAAGEQVTPGSMLKSPLGENQRAGIPDIDADAGAVPVTGRRLAKGVDYSQYTSSNYTSSGGVKQDAKLGKMPESLNQDRMYPRDI